MAVHRLRTDTPSAGAITHVERMERLRNDANALAVEHVNALIAALTEATTLADQVANGGEAYKIGVREIARRMHKELGPTVLSLRALRERRP